MASTLNRDELARFLSEHLTAAALMVLINDPISRQLYLGERFQM